MYTIKKISLLTLSTLFIFSLLNTPVTYARRAIPDDNLAYPVLVTYEKGSGSGFYVNTEVHVFFVTARHILFKESKIEKRIDYSLKSKSVNLLSYPKDPNDKGRIILGLDLETLNNSGNIRFHKDYDIAVVCMGSILKDEKGQTSGKFKFLKGIHRIEKTKSSLIGVDSNSIKKFDSILISNDVFIFGYPRSIGIKDTPQIEYDRPLLRKGIVAGKNRTEKTIILDCPIYPGNSGGPVLEVDQTTITRTEYRLIGVLSEFIPFAQEWINIKFGLMNREISNSGYSVATPMDPVLELISDLEEQH